jgi:hypothetical protein
VYNGVYDVPVLAATYVMTREAIATPSTANSIHFFLISLALTFIFSPPSSF